MIVTNDNPRNEDPVAIVSDIVAGAGDNARLEVIQDRSAAICHAIRSADSADVVLIAGKGHERFQHIGSESVPFNDASEARRVLGMGQ